jgi:hypothetical protein
MNPIVRYMLLCDDIRIDADDPACVHVECLLTNVVSLEFPPFPLLREMLCVYLMLTECYGNGVAQIRVVYSDGEHEVPLFGSPERLLDFAGILPSKFSELCSASKRASFRNRVDTRSSSGIMVRCWKRDHCVRRRNHERQIEERRRPSHRAIPRSRHPAGEDTCGSRRRGTPPTKSTGEEIRPLPRPQDDSGTPNVSSPGEGGPTNT